MSCSTEKPDKPFPRILRSGDLILSGYGPRLRGQTADRAYVYTWSGFVGNPRAKALNTQAFVAAGDGYNWKGEACDQLARTVCETVSGTSSR